MEHGFDPAFCMDMPKPEHGVGHAFMRPAESLTDLHTPIIPILLNCYYAPQATGMRSYEFGKAPCARPSKPSPKTCASPCSAPAACGTRPGAKSPSWTKTSTARCSSTSKGDIKGMAQHFDNYTPRRATPASPSTSRAAKLRPACPASAAPQGGTRETCNWIVASAVADGKPATVDYVPVYASPIGCGFAYWPEV